jgi:hypothetical protein
VRIEIIHSSSNDVKEAYKEIERKIEKVDFEPKFLFLFLTAGTWKKYKVFSKLFQERFPNAKMLGCIVEGFIVENDIWMRGLAALLVDFDGKVEVFWAKEKNATETIEKLGERVGRGWDTILLMFPAFYFPGKFELLRFFFNDKRYYRKFSRKDSFEERKRVLEDYSRFLESRFVFPINKTLKIMAEKTGRKTQIIGMNLVPLEASYNTPLIMANYKDIGRGAAAVCFKGKVNAIFHDIFPERGKSYEETFEIIKNYFSEVEQVEVTKGGVAIGEINGMKPTDFIKTRKYFGNITQEDVLKKIEEGKFQMASPYGLAFVSQKTHGSAVVGLADLPINVFPSLFNVNEFYDTAIFCGEFFRGGIKSSGKIFDKKKLLGFDFFIIDQNTIMSFGGDIHKLIDVIKEKSNNPYFGVFSTPPSTYSPNLSEKFFSEIDNKICVNVAGTSAILEFA